MKAIKLPVGFSGGKLLAETDPEKIVQQKIIDVLVTSRRERVMNHTYGMGAYELLYEPIDTLIMSDFKQDALQDLRRYVSGASIIDVQMTNGAKFNTPDPDTTLVVTVYYKMPYSQPTSVTFNVTEFLSEESYV